MLLNDKSGICCDLCSMKCHTDFDYYSLDFRMIHLSGSYKPAIEQILRMPIFSSIDLCGNCFYKVRDQIIRVNKIPSRKLRCDVSGEMIKDVYYYCVVSKVKVKMSNMPSVCNTCRTPTHNPVECPKCGGRNYTKSADMKVDNRYIDICLSTCTYDKMIAETERNKSNAKDWSTNS